VKNQSDKERQRLERKTFLASLFGIVCFGFAIPRGTMDLEFSEQIFAVLCLFSFSAAVVFCVNCARAGFDRITLGAVASLLLPPLFLSQVLPLASDVGMKNLHSSFVQALFSLRS
jgi:hypothetical protein